MIRKVLFAGTMLIFSAASGGQSLGLEGRDGRDAQQGRDAPSRGAVKWDVNGTSVTFDGTGTNGTDAFESAQDGSDASQCGQPNPHNKYGRPIPNQDLMGAPGGNGGDGARGGNGGNGSDVFLYLSSDTQIPLLKKVTIKNRGGGHGNNAPAAKGGLGCKCTYYTWNIKECTWTFFRVVNGQKRSGWVADEKTNCTFNSTPPAYSPYYDGKWEQVSQFQKRYQCTDGRKGRDGISPNPSVGGKYGSVVLYTGVDSKTTLNSRLSGKLEEVVDKEYLFTGADYEKRTGLKSLLAPSSDVTDTFWIRKFMKRKLKIEWKAQTSISESGLANAPVSVTLDGSAAQPKFQTQFPGNLVLRTNSLADTTVLTISRVINTDNPAKITACTKYNAKGAALCELSGQCTYFPEEGGDCLPK